jgi:phage gp29-like protein
MANELLDQLGRPYKHGDLTREIARASLTAVRSPLTGYPADGLTPARLGAILREADAGEPLRYLELLEFAEERDPHYAGVMATRRRSVAQLPITVEAFSDAAAHEADAEVVRDWLRRGILRRALFDVLDCLPKGFAMIEIIWARSRGAWMPERLVRRDPRWFRFDRTDLETPLMLSDSGAEVPLPPAKFILARIQAKSGLPLRSGLGRIGLWSYLFKKYTERDWQQFIQTYGQPLRLGKWASGATEDDKKTLFEAVANIAGDCAAIVPETMAIEFIQSGQLSATGQLYNERADWIDRQVSKLVLGQTATTDAVTGGLGSGKEHRQVQEDIERSDAEDLAAILSDQLIAPWMALSGRDPAEAPRLQIARPEEEDLEAFGRALAPFIDRGLKVPLKTIREKFGLPEAQADEEVLTPASGPKSGPDGAAVGEAAEPGGRASKFKGVSGVFKGGQPPPGTVRHLSAERPPAAPPARTGEADDAAALLAARMAAEADPAMGAILMKVETMVDAAGSMEELALMLRAGFGAIDDAALRAALGRGLVAAHLAGRASAETDSDGD